MLATTKSLIRQQGRFINKVVIIELDNRRKKLSDYQTRARFALAESYDKATQKQARDLEEQIRSEKEAQSVPDESQLGEETDASNPSTDNALPSEDE